MERGVSYMPAARPIARVLGGTRPPMRGQMNHTALTRMAMMGYMIERMSTQGHISIEARVRKNCEDTRYSAERQR